MITQNADPRMDNIFRPKGWVPPKLDPRSYAEMPKGHVPTLAPQRRQAQPSDTGKNMTPKRARRSLPKAIERSEDYEPIEPSAGECDSGDAPWGPQIDKDLQRFRGEQTARFQERSQRFPPKVWPAAAPEEPEPEPVKAEVAAVVPEPDEVVIPTPVDPV